MADYIEQLQSWITQKKLVRIELLKGRGLKQHLIGNILNYDAGDAKLIFYHADEKKVYNLNLNEIEDIRTAG